MKAKAPACLRLLLWPDEGDELRLVNKFYDSPLCIQQDRVVCYDALDKELLCSATVDSDEKLINLGFKSGGKTMAPLDAWTPEGSTKVAWEGIQWKLRAVDEHHVKIGTIDGIIFNHAF
jgi:hypothetical protein